MASNKIFTKQLYAPLVDMPKLLEYLHGRGRRIKLVAHNPHLQLILWIYMQQMCNWKQTSCINPCWAGIKKHEQMPHGYFKVYNSGFQKIKILILIYNNGSEKLKKSQITIYKITSFFFNNCFFHKNYWFFEAFWYNQNKRFLDSKFSQVQVP